MRKIAFILNLTALFFITDSKAQTVFLAKWSPLNAYMNTFSGSNDFYYGGRINLQQFAGSFELMKSREQTYKVGMNTVKHLQWNGTFSYRFAEVEKEGGDIHKGYYITLGANKLNTYKLDEWNAVDLDLKPAYDSGETMMKYNEYFQDVEVKSSYLNIGVESFKKALVDLPGGWVTVLLVDPFGFVIGSYRSYSPGSEVFYCRNSYFNLLLATPGSLGYTTLGYHEGGKNNLVTAPDMHTEPLYKNLVGFKMGYDWSSLGIAGLNYGFECGMFPGVYNTSGVYGFKFPDDNIYFMVRVGVSTGLWTKPE